MAPTEPHSEFACPATCAQLLTLRGEMEPFDSMTLTIRNPSSIRSMLDKLRPQEDTTRQTEAEEEGPISAEQQRKTRSSTLKPADPWRSGLSKRWGRLLYSYFNWRQAGL